MGQFLRCHARFDCAFSMPMTCLRLAVASAALALTACAWDTEPNPLTDTLLFAPGTDVTYRGQPAKLYGSSTCHVGGLLGASCFLLTPTRASDTASLVTPKRAYDVVLRVKRDPRNPSHYVLEDPQGQRITSTSGEENVLEFVYMGL